MRMGFNLSRRREGELKRKKSKSSEPALFYFLDPTNREEGVGWSWIEKAWGERVKGITTNIQKGSEER